LKDKMGVKCIKPSKMETNCFCCKGQLLCFNQLRFGMLH
jgi:hypothetical protein